MRSDKAFWEHHDRVSIDMQFIPKLEHTVLENINNIFRKLVGVPLTSLDRGFDFSENCLIGVAEGVDMSSELPHEAIELTCMYVLLQVADDQIFKDYRCNTKNMFFLTLLVCELI